MVSPLTVEDFIKQIKEARKEGNLGVAKSVVLCARSLFPTDLFLMNQHYQVLVQEGNFKSAAQVVTTLFEKNPRHDNFVFLFLQILSPHFSSSPLLPSTAPRLKELLSNFKQKETPNHSSLFASSNIPSSSLLHTSNSFSTNNIPNNNFSKNDVLSFLDAATKEKMITACCTYFVEKKEYSVACLLYSLLISWQSPDQNSPHWNQAAELALACEKQQNLPIFNPFREFLARIVAISPAHSKTYLQAIQFHLAKCNWHDLTLLFSHLISPYPSSSSLSSSSSSPPLSERLVKEGWTQDVCAQCALRVREWVQGYSAGSDAQRAEAPREDALLALGVCVLVRSLWSYYCVIAGVGENEGGESNTGNIPFVLIYDFGDEIQEITAASHTQKKRKLNESTSTDAREGVGAHPALSLAHEMWTFLNSPSVSSDFTRVWTEWGYSDKIWVHLALGDMFMHSKHPEQARTILTKVETILTNRSFSSSSSSSSSSSAHTATRFDAHFLRKLETQHDMWIDRTRLQTAMCHMCESAGDESGEKGGEEEERRDLHVRKAAVKMLEVLVDRPFPSDSAFLPLALPSPIPTPSQPLTTSPYDPAFMTPCFVPLSENEVLLRCVSGLVWCYIKMGHQKMGNVLVLLQANWTRYSEAFSRIAQTVLSGNGLSYDSFFDYVVNPDILEEIAFLDNSGAPLQLYGSAAFLKTCETLHDMLEVHLQASSTSDNMSIPAILPRFAAAEMLRLCA